MEKLTHTLRLLFIGAIAIAIASLTSCSTSRNGCMSSYFVGYAKIDKVNYEDDIHNPDNDEYVREVAFNLGVKPSQVTQKQFNARYGIK
tara:strand:- start:820 stop:1086 length:267 start_codon:yes stop_codon:yes gene_type:complete